MTTATSLSLNIVVFVVVFTFARTAEGSAHAWENTEETRNKNSIDDRTQHVFRNCFWKNLLKWVTLENVKGLFDNIFEKQFLG